MPAARHSSVQAFATTGRGVGAAAWLSYYFGTARAETS